MEAPSVHIVHYAGCNVECYGELSEDSNFSVICADEEYDEVWCDGNVAGSAFTTWEEVVECLQREYGSRIIEISAV